MRILSLDIGDKRIGLAVSDPFNTYALPLKTYFRKNLKTDLTEIAKIIKEKEITTVVCGLPVNFDGSESIQTKKTGYFIEKLKETVLIPIITVDERCTTVEAERVLIEENMRREDRKQVVDAIAATYILEGYLNNLNKKGDNKMEEKKTCGCGCGHDDCNCESETCEHENIVEFTDEDGTVIKCALIETIDYKGKTYAAFEAVDDIEDEEADTVYIYEVVDNEDGETSDLVPVEDDALLDEVFEELCRMFEAQDEAELAEEQSNL